MLCAPPGAPNFNGNQANSWVQWGGLQNGSVPSVAPGTTCPLAGSSTSACTYLLAENSLWATYNNVKPQFAAASITDEFRPSDKWLFNLGVRLDSFTFNGLNGDINNNGGAARQFFYNAYNLDTCVVAATGLRFPTARPARRVRQGRTRPGSRTWHTRTSRSISGSRA